MVEVEVEVEVGERKNESDGLEGEKELKRDHSFIHSFIHSAIHSFCDPDHISQQRKEKVNCWMLVQSSRQEREEKRREETSCIKTPQATCGATRATI